MTLKFWHQIRLPDGTITPGKNNCEEKVKTFWRISPKDISEKTVLDIGAFNGGFSFIFEKWGAKSILATDSYAWDRWGIQTIQYCIDKLKSKVKIKHCEPYKISPQTVGTFDVVLFSGVFYHLRNPLLALDCAISVVNPNGTLYVETHVNTIDNKADIPQMTYYPEKDSHYGDDTNWFGPNIAMMHCLLSPYFKSVDHVYDGVATCFFHCKERNNKSVLFENLSS